MTHSSGPWFTMGRRGRLTIVAKGTGTVCHVEKSNPNRDDDARLIAAAPQMLEALQTARDGFEYGGMQSDYDNILAAIQLAIGTQS